MMSQKKYIVLRLLAMRIFNSHGIYFPSNLKLKKVICNEEFLKCYADNPISIRVCFDKVPSSKTMVQNSKVTTVYKFGLGIYYLV